MKKKIIIYIALNTLPFSKDRLNENWIDYRLEIFTKYTLQSLINQTNQDFTCLIVYDDKTDDIVRKCVSKYPEFPANIILSKINVDFAYSQISKGYLHESNDIINLISSNDYLYLVRIDSDDMYSPSFVQQLHDFNHKPDTQVILNENGYIYDVHGDRISKIHYVSPPFYTLVYKVDEYINGFRYALKNGHQDVINLIHETLYENNFTIIVHGKNIYTQFLPGPSKTPITDELEKEEIKKELFIRKYTDI